MAAAPTLKTQAGKRWAGHRDWANRVDYSSLVALSIQGMQRSGKLFLVISVIKDFAHNSTGTNSSVPSVAHGQGCRPGRGGGSQGQATLRDRSSAGLRQRGAQRHRAGDEAGGQGLGERAAEGAGHRQGGGQGLRVGDAAHTGGDGGGGGLARGREAAPVLVKPIRDQ